MTTLVHTNGKLQKRKYRGFKLFASLNQPRYLHDFIYILFTCFASVLERIYIFLLKKKVDQIIRLANIKIYPNYKSLHLINVQRNLINSFCKLLQTLQPYIYITIIFQEREY